MLDQMLDDPVHVAYRAHNMAVVKERQIRIGTFNVRYDGRSSHPVPIPAPTSHPTASPFPPNGQKYIWGEQPWSVRRHKVADTVLFHEWDLFAFQEVLANQLDDLSILLGKDEFRHVGVGREDGVKKGEAVPIFWRKELFEAVPESRGGTGVNGVTHFWLSETPEVVGSVGWDAGQTRMCTHLALRWREAEAKEDGEARSGGQSGQIVHVFSTHYDEKGARSREGASALIRKRTSDAVRKTKEVQGGRGQEPLVLLLGDLNSPRSQGGWKVLTAGRYDTPRANSIADAEGKLAFLDSALELVARFASPESLAAVSSLPATFDSLSLNSPNKNPRGGILSAPWGARRTYTGFSRVEYEGSDGQRPEDAVIDYILLGDNRAVREKERRYDGATADGDEGAKWRVTRFGVLDNWSDGGDGGWLVSDHRAVMAVLEMS